MAAIREVCESFMEIRRADKYHSIKINTVEGIMKIFLEKYPGTELSAVALSGTIVETVRSYSSSKATAIEVLKEFQGHAEMKYGIRAMISYPKVDISNSFERMMYIVKFLQDSEKTMADLYDEIWVSERTLEEDLAKLRGKDPIQVLGRQLLVKDIERRDGKVLFSSTVHPLFLTLNLSQALTMLMGLKVMARKPLYSEYAKVTATAIWNQLSDYGRNRLLKVLKELLGEETRWYESLSSFEPELFSTESEIGSKSPESAILDCMKNKKPINVEYLSEDGPAWLKDCRVLPGTFTGEGISVISNGQEHFLVFDKIIRVSNLLEDLL